MGEPLLSLADCQIRTFLSALTEFDFYRCEPAAAIRSGMP
jgi:hypothetical protein